MDLTLAVPLVAMIVWQEVRYQLALRSGRKEREKAERLAKAESLHEFTASEALLCRPPPKKGPAQEQKPRLYDEMFGTTPTKGG